jgi:hypothetical protein
MTNKETMKLALEALKDATLHIWLGDKKGSEANIRAHKAIDVLEAELAKQEQGEPDKYVMDIECTKCGAKQSGILTVNTTPQQRTWVGLTEEERDEIYLAVELGANGEELIEAKLKEKNNG